MAGLIRQTICLTAILVLGSCRGDAFLLPSSGTSCQSFFPYRSDVNPRRSDSALHYKGDSGTSEKDFYSVLGISKAAGDTEIKGAYRKLAKLYHPGKPRNQCCSSLASSSRGAAAAWIVD